MDLSKKDKSELIDIIEDLKCDLEEANDELETVQQELSDANGELSALEHTAESEEDIAEKAFFAGFNSDYSEALKGWLNYKIEAEL